jgi:hypothetical protein
VQDGGHYFLAQAAQCGRRNSHHKGVEAKKETSRENRDRIDPDKKSALSM